MSDAFPLRKDTQRLERRGLARAARIYCAPKW